MLGALLTIVRPSVSEGLSVELFVGSRARTTGPGQHESRQSSWPRPEAYLTLPYRMQPTNATWTRARRLRLEGGRGRWRVASGARRVACGVWRAARGARRVARGCVHGRCGVGPRWAVRHRDAGDVVVELLHVLRLGREEQVAADEDEARLGVANDLEGDRARLADGATDTTTVALQILLRSAQYSVRRTGPGR